MRCVRITGSDDRMDRLELSEEPINPLPRKCEQCGFPDLDFVPEPYFVIKSRSLMPNELALAENGNILIRDRIRRVLDLLVPGQCTCVPTYYRGTTEKTPWWLAIPNHQVISAKVKASIPHCVACGELRSAHPGEQWSECLFCGTIRDVPMAKDWTCESDYEILKSANWSSSERGWNLWMLRHVFFSVRLLHLLKKIKAKGFYECTLLKPASPNKAESAWIKEKLQLLEANGIPFHAEGTLSESDTKWFGEYVKTNARKVEVDWDVKTVERRVKAKLPKSYLDFVSTVGPTNFENIDQKEGFNVSILNPNEIGVEEYFADFEDEESKAVNGLTFASTEHGDSFCFDVKKGRKEYAIFLYNHECNVLEPYTDSFATCIKRFAGG